MQSQVYRPGMNPWAIIVRPSDGMTLAQTFMSGFEANAYRPSFGRNDPSRDIYVWVWSQRPGMNPWAIIVRPSD